MFDINAMVKAVEKLTEALNRNTEETRINTAAMAHHTSWLIKAATIDDKKRDDKKEG